MRFWRRLQMVGTALAAGAGAPSVTLLAQADPEAEVRAAVDRYNAAFTSRDLTTLKTLLAPDIVLYEHSVRNIGLEDAWENHLKPEIQGFQFLNAEFADVRVWVAGDVAIVTRQYSIQATMNGRPIDARGNETMGWVKRDGAWKVVHLHYSHPCQRSPAG